MRRLIAAFVVALATLTAVALPAGGKDDVLAPPRRILLIGDSVMGEVAAAAEAATAGRATIDYVLTIGTANVKDDWWDVWPRVVARDQPDDVVVLVGPWEIDRPDLGSASWASWYGGRLDRWAGALRAGGASLHWMTALPTRDAVGAAKLNVVNGAFRSAASANGADVVDSAGALGSPGYVERSATGERLRRIDGLHLCPAGAAALASALLADLHVPVTPGWEHGEWAHAGPAYSAEECPA